MGLSVRRFPSLLACLSRAHVIFMRLVRRLTQMLQPVQRFAYSRVKMSLCWTLYHAFDCIASQNHALIKAC